MNKAVFLDRDGTINVEKHYLYKEKDFEFLPGVIKGLKMLQAAGFLLIIITNQSGIGRGYYTENDYWKLTSFMCNELKIWGVYLSDIFYCPHHPNAMLSQYRIKCNCRKPQTGLFRTAVEKWNIDLARSWALGDKERDCSICMESECKGIILNKRNILHFNDYRKYNIYCLDNFLKAVQFILDDEVRKFEAGR